RRGPRMAITAVQVYNDAASFLGTLKGMTAKQKEQTPTRTYGEEYNRLLALAKAVAPEVDPRLWPVPVSLIGDEAIARYAEIENYLCQLLAHLPEDRRIL